MKIYEDAWEPTTADIIRMFTRDWMMHNPAPRWLMADSALYYVSEETREFCGKSGTGLLIAPPECHWLMSHEEQLVGRLKATVGRMMKEDLDLAVATMFHYACHAHNSTIQAPPDTVLFSGCGELFRQTRFLKDSILEKPSLKF